MEDFNQVQDANDKRLQSNTETPLAGSETRQEELNRKLSSVFPYFKQLSVAANSSKSESLPEDLSIIDQQKSYSVSGLQLIIKNICDDLNCLYAYDTEAGLELIQERELEKLHINRDQLHEIAMANYRQLLKQQLNAQNNGEAFWFILDGNLEAGLVLVDEIWDQVAGFLKEEIVLCVPSRDVIFATGKSNNAAITDFTERARQILTSGDHPLSNNWFIREDKQWRVFRKIID